MHQPTKIKLRYLIVFTLVITLGVFFRFFNLNWDQNQHLHPDERFLTMVGLELKLPQSISQYLDPSISPLNPYNSRYNFFVYGTFPLSFNRWLTEKIGRLDYGNFTLTGRFLSALFETGTLALVYLISINIFGCYQEKKKIALLALFFYSISVLPIQLAHFFAVDTFLVFFLTLSFYLYTSFVLNSKISFLTLAFLGGSLGLALACKITALPMMFLILTGVIINFLSRKKFSVIPLAILILLSFTYFFLRLGDPRIFSNANFFNIQINPQFIDNLEELARYNNPISPLPPGVQWIKTKPIIFPLKNLVLWGWGLPLGLAVILALIIMSFRLVKQLSLSIKKGGFLSRRDLHFSGLTLIFIFLNFIYQGSQFTKAMRYFYPLYPFMAILSGFVFYQLFFKLKKLIKKNRDFIFIFSVFAFFILIMIYPVSFLSIHTHPHPRLAASYWIYDNIPSGSTLTCEAWDDCLPVSLGNKISQIYQVEQLPLYDQDKPEKWEKINSILAKADYMILSSNRLWGSIPKVPEMFPQTTEFYRKLFAEELGFIKVAEFTSYPCFPPIGQAWFCFPDQLADETFTVYDHPKVLIYKNINLH